MRILVNKLIMLPGPTNVHKRVRKAMEQPSISHRGKEFHELHARVEENLKYVFQTQNDIMILSSSGTGAIECVIANTVSPGDKVIIFINGFFGERLKQVVECKGGVPIEIQVEWGEAIKTDSVRDALDRNSDAMSVMLVSNETSTGVLNPVEEIARIVNRHGKLLITDSVSHVGGAELKVDKWKIDICISASQKCLACPPGLAFVSINNEAWKAIEKNNSKSLYFDLLRCREYHKKNETPYTPAVPLFFALNESLQMISEETLRNWLRRQEQCSEVLREGVKKLDLELFVGDRSSASPTVTSILRPKGINVSELRELMENRNGIIVGGGIGKLRDKIFRIGTMGIVRKSYVKKTLLALSQYVNQ